MKKIIKNIIFLMFVLILCSCMANNGKFMTELKPNMDIRQARILGNINGFNTGQTRAIYKGYTLTIFSKRKADSVCVITDHNNKIIAIESYDYEKNYNTEYLTYFIDTIKRERREYKIEFK